MIKKTRKEGRFKVVKVDSPRVPFYLTSRCNINNVHQLKIPLKLNVCLFWKFVFVWMSLLPPYPPPPPPRFLPSLLFTDFFRFRKINEIHPKMMLISKYCNCKSFAGQTIEGWYDSRSFAMHSGKKSIRFRVLLLSPHCC